MEIQVEQSQNDTIFPETTLLTHWSPDKIAKIFHSILWNAFYWMTRNLNRKINVYWLQFLKRFFFLLGSQLIILCHWFRQWPATKQMIKWLSNSQRGISPITPGNAWVRSQHCGYWCPGAKAPGHQHPQCWLNIHCSGPISYKNWHLCCTTLENKNTFWKKWPSRLRVKTPTMIRMTQLWLVSQKWHDREYMIYSNQQKTVTRCGKS